MIFWIQTTATIPTGEKVKPFNFDCDAVSVDDLCARLADEGHVVGDAILQTTDGLTRVRQGIFSGKVEFIRTSTLNANLLPPSLPPDPVAA